MTGEHPFKNPPDGVVCDDCGYPMAHVRTGADAYGTLFHFACSKCPAHGTVELRSEKSAAANAPLEKYHGKTTAGGTADD
jgi:hypothetical protein